ncbi:hypothetical protein [Macrococcus equipercicus]|uniref:Uncharacterized protein n=1 Tax=Macrococcus equipercicus TaxID=69967 RepID=A0A9Q9BW32_9STAP|nr:hypothetical protein [Macrococcus equipercicus]KAA1036590.1 hypothetical protein ERX35_010595 [Macrococcus equipercicus]UTH13477.1 hypothetical protein KFV11_09620 [Macrococcus equipercicus]
MTTSLQREVKQLMYGEGASAAGFIILWGITAVINEEARSYLLNPLYIVPLLTICIILAAGSYFWSIMNSCIKEKRPVRLTAAQRSRFAWLHRLIIIAMITATILMVINLPVSQPLLLILIYSFMWLEYINYFHMRLSYLSPREFKQLLIHRKPARSQLSRALRSK